MAQAIKTVLTYQLDGATKDFNIPFEYLARKFVVVTLIGVDRKTLVLNQDYRFATRNIISTTLAWGPANGYNQIEIRRFTSATERLVDFADGSILRAYDLNVSQIQTLHVAEEARDLTADTIGVNNDGNLDARGRRIVNLADAVADSDAISFGQVKRMNENAWQSRNEALQFRNEAEAFKNESGTNSANTLQWRNEAEQFKNQAFGFRNEAEQFKNQAGTFQADAAVSAQTAREHGNRAQTYSNAARAARDEATTQADRAKTEADKLGNWNALGGAIDAVTNEYVRWNRNHQSSKVVAAYTETNKDYRMRMTTWEDGEFVSGDLAMDQPSGFSFIRLAAHKSDASRHQIDINQHVVAHKVIESDAEGVIGAAFAQQYTTKAPLFQQIKVQSTSSYHPIVKQNTFQAGRWGGSWSIGTLLTGSAASFHVFVIDENGTSKLWGFTTDGTFSSPGNLYSATGISTGGDIVAAGTIHAGSGVAKFLPTGDLVGGAWDGGALSTWLRKWFVGGVATTEPGSAAAWRGPGSPAPGWGRVITGVVNVNQNEYIDTIHWVSVRNNYHDGHFTNLY